jgi:hypothetical protein
MEWLTTDDAANSTAAPRYVASSGYYGYVLVISLLNFLTNTLLVLFIWIAKLDRDSNRFIFIGELASGAIVVSVANVVNCIGRLTSESFPSLSGCKALYIIVMAGIQEASLNLVALVTDQYILIAHPLRYRAVCTQKVGWVVAYSIFAIVCIFAGITAYLWDDGEGCNFTSNLPAWHHMINYGIVIVLPLTVVVTLQVLTIRISRRHLRQIQISRVVDGESEERMVKRHWRGVVTNALICGALIVDWMPITVAFCITTADPNAIRSTKFLTFLDYAGSMYQNYGLWLPLIYAVRSPEVSDWCKRLKARCQAIHAAQQINQK